MIYSGAGLGRQWPSRALGVRADLSSWPCVKSPARPATRGRVPLTSEPLTSEHALCKGLPGEGGAQLSLYPLCPGLLTCK